MLSDSIPATSGTDAVVERIRQEISRIETSVTELSHFSEPARAVLQRRNLHEVIDKALDRVPLGATTHVKRDYDRALPLLPIDERLLGEALRRIFVNARDAMPSGGTLWIATSWEKGRARVAVRDSGGGFDASSLGSVFEPFVSSKTRGLGLGLAITRRFVEAQGGSVSARTSGASGGAELVVELPHSDADRKP